MHNSVKVASLKVSGEKRSEVESKVGQRILKICNTRLFSEDVSFSCSVEWSEASSNSPFEATINIYYQYESKEVEKQHCDICRETHDLFYCNRQYNCNQCEFAAYRFRAISKEKTMRACGRRLLGIKMERKKKDPDPKE